MKSKRVHRPAALGAVAGLGLTLAVLPVTPAHAVTIVPCGNVTALRNAITQSNTTNESIVLAPSCTYVIDNLDPTPGNLDNGLPRVTGRYTITGFNTTVRRSADTMTPSFRVFEVVSGGRLTLNSINVRGGHLHGNDGGGIQVDGVGSTLTVQSGSVTENFANQGGGIDISNSASATLNSTLVSGNEAIGTGGGISHTGARLTVNSTRIQGNTAAEGGGLRTAGSAIAVLTASQVTGNTATTPGTPFAGGGGIFEAPGGSQVALVLTNVSGNTPFNCRPALAVPGCSN
ncbi:hypothetical protein [Streptomyces sp. NPDC096132]|uniref:hypothetical protein n=1 Tax=Streptomyces sp. NPDC096132 TaxID=3366075 RepID=UPI00380CC5AC